MVQSELLKQLNSYHLWLNNVLDDQFIVPENIIDEAGLAYAVFLHLKKGLANVLIRKNDNYQFCSNGDLFCSLLFIPFIFQIISRDFLKEIPFMSKYST